MSSRILMSFPVCGKIKMSFTKIDRKIHGVVCPNFGTVPIPGSIIITDKDKQKIIPSYVTYDGELIFPGEVYKKYKNQNLDILFLVDDDINSLSISDLDSKEAVLKSLRNIETLSIFLYQRMMFNKYVCKSKGLIFNTWIISSQAAISDDGKIVFFEKFDDDFPGICTLKEWCYLNKPFIKIVTISTFSKVNWNCSLCKREFSISDILNANIVNEGGNLKHKHC